MYLSDSIQQYYNELGRLEVIYFEYGFEIYLNKCFSSEILKENPYKKNDIDSLIEIRNRQIKETKSEINNIEEDIKNKKSISLARMNEYEVFIFNKECEIEYLAMVLRIEDNKVKAFKNYDERSDTTTENTHIIFSQQFKNDIRKSLKQSKDLYLKSETKRDILHKEIKDFIDNKNDQERKNEQDKQEYKKLAEEKTRLAREKEQQEKIRIKEEKQEHKRLAEEKTKLAREKEQAEREAKERLEREKIKANKKERLERVKLEEKQLAIQEERQKRQDEADERQQQRDYEIRKLELELQLQETQLLREREEREVNRATIDSLKDTLKDS